MCSLHVRGANEFYYHLRTCMDLLVYHPLSFNHRHFIVYSMEFDFVDNINVAYLLKRFMSLVQKVELSGSRIINYYYFVVNENYKFAICDFEIGTINKYLSLIDIQIKVVNDKLIIEEK